MRTMIAIAFVLCSIAAAQGQVSVGGPFCLCIQPNARSAGMGNCTVAVTDDASACSWNPGGLAFMKGRVNVTGVFTHPVPDWDEVEYVYGACGVRVDRVGVFAGSVTHLTFGKQVATSPDSPDPIGYFEPYEIVRSIAYSRAFWDHVGLGVNYKHVRVELVPAEYTQDDEKGSGSTDATDMGVEFRAGYKIADAELLVRAGAAVLHSGSEIKFTNDEKWPLPKVALFGASGRLSYARAIDILLCAQYQRPIPEDTDIDPSGIWGVGAEFEGSFLGFRASSESEASPGFRDLLSVRLGYVVDEDGDVEGFSYGFGAGVDMSGTAVLRLDCASVPVVEGLKRPWRTQLSGSLCF